MPSLSPHRPTTAFPHLAFRRLGRRCRRLLVLLVACLSGAGALISPALATCLPVAEAPGALFMRAGLGGASPGSLARAPSPLLRAGAERGPAPPGGTVELTFLGHSSFLIRTPKDVTAVTDYNGYIRTTFPPDIVTMNHAHETHYTDFVDPAIRHVLRGWTTARGFPRFDVRYRDMRVRNVPTNIRDGTGGTEFAGNSIFVFETTGLCIAHLGHLHHLLSPEHVGRIGEVDVALVPIDDGFTLTQEAMAEAVDALKPRVVVPMHYFAQHMAERFATLMAGHGYAARYVDGPSVILSKRTLPRRTILVLAGELY